MEQHPLASATYASLHVDERRQRFQRQLIAIKLLEPMIEDARREDEKPLDLLTRLCGILEHAMDSAPDGQSWWRIWLKYVRWESLREEWAQSYTKMVRFAPEHLIIIGVDTPDGPEHPNYDSRTSLPLDPAMLASIQANGVLQVISIAIVDGQPVVIDGRRRVMHAREAGCEEVTCQVVRLRDAAAVSDDSKERD